MMCFTRFYNFSENHFSLKALFKSRDLKRTGLANLRNTNLVLVKNSICTCFSLVMDSTFGGFISHSKLLCSIFSYNQCTVSFDLSKYMSSLRKDKKTWQILVLYSFEQRETSLFPFLLRKKSRIRRLQQIFRQPRKYLVPFIWYLISKTLFDS